MISQDIIDSILDRADIVEVIGRFEELKKAGTGYVCCCPFHKEKTPSFHVSPARQSWHCFGGCQEGGNVIGYLMRREGMTFPEAVRWLGNRYGIEVEEEAEEPEARQARLRREAFFGINERVAAFYAGLLREKRDAGAWNYAVGRWGQDYVMESGMGFAPAGWSTLLEWARERGENVEFLIELGLLRRNEETGKVYDAYRNRLMMPIRDRSRRITGFTARTLDEGDGVAKYINSPESCVYSKGKSVFGVDEAWREGCRTGVFYLVEGAPDAMKMHAVGINNAVAPLGGAWTREQLLLLKKAAPAVCFINDADPVPAGGGWGPGIEYVLRGGQLAVELGLSVTVRELPCAEGNRKQDPGSFFTSRAMMKQLEEEDFVVWAAGKWFGTGGDTVARRTENVRRVAGLASHIADEMQVEMILPALCKFAKGKEMWRGAISQARWQRTKKEEVRREGVDLRQYGFFQQAGCYYGQTEKGGELQWSNFTMRPLFHIRDAEQPRRLFLFKGSNGREDIVEMTMEDLNSPSRFRQKIEGIGNYIWMGGEREMIKLKNYLYDQTETAGIIRQMGWSAQGFYAFGNGIWREGEFHRTDDYGVVRLGAEEGNWYIPAASKVYREQGRKFEWERKFVHTGLNSVKTGDYLRDFVQVYGDNGKVGLCYWVASLFRDIIAGHTRSFPLLDLFGPKGSGKTELGAALMAFFVTDNKAPNLRNSTAVALNDAVAFASDALVHLDEYKNDIDSKKIEFLKGLYDGVGRVKMGGTGFDSRVMTSVRCGVVVSGQEIPTADIALFHRCIYLAFPRSEFSEAERRRFAALREVQKLGLTSLTLEVLRLRKRFEGGFPDTYNAVLDDINRRTGFRKLETRIVENWAKALAAFRCVETKLPWPFSYEEILGIAVEGIIVQNRMSGEGNEVAKFWEIAQYLRDNGELFNESDWRIQPMARIKTDRLERTFPAPASILLLNTSRIFILYKRACISMGSKPLPDDALREYLKNSDYYLGTKNAVRFKSIIKGYEESTPAPEPGKVNKMGKVTRAMCFDYAVIRERYGVTLTTSSFDACADDGDAPEAPPEATPQTQEAELPF